MTAPRQQPREQITGRRGRHLPAEHHAPAHRALADCALQESTIDAVYPDNRLMSTKVRAFVDHLARHFGRPRGWTPGGS